MLVRARGLRASIRTPWGGAAQEGNAVEHGDLEVALLVFLHAEAEEAILVGIHDSFALAVEADGLAGRDLDHRRTPGMLWKGSRSQRQHQ
jgi:hypothetical protein